MEKRGKIFIIEDEPNFIEEAIGDIYHWKVSTFDYYAINLAAAFLPDIIILEGSFKGLALCPMIRKNPILQETKLVILLEKECIAGQIKAFRAGANEVVSKPFSGKELLQALDGLFLNQSFIDDVITQEKE